MILNSSTSFTDLKKTKTVKAFHTGELENISKFLKGIPVPAAEEAGLHLGTLRQVQYRQKIMERGQLFALEVNIANLRAKPVLDRVIAFGSRWYREYTKIRSFMFEKWKGEGTHCLWYKNLEEDWEEDNLEPNLSFIILNPQCIIHCEAVN